MEASAGGATYPPLSSAIIKDILKIFTTIIWRAENTEIIKTKQLSWRYRENGKRSVLAPMPISRAYQDSNLIIDA